MDATPALGSNDNPPTLPSRIDDLEEIVGFISDLASSITTVQTSLGLTEDSTETVADLLAALHDRLEQLKLEVSPLFQLPRRLEGVEAKANAQERAMSQLSETVLGFSHSLRELDLGQQGHTPSGTGNVTLVP